MNKYSIRKIKLSNNEEIAFREAGKSDIPLILLHGNLSASIHYDNLMRKLEKDIRVIAIDLRGFGDSSYNSSFDSLKELALDVELLLKELQIKEYHALGWSTGGGVALELAKMNNGLKKLILLSSVGLEGIKLTNSNGEILKTKEEIGNHPQVKPVLDALESKNALVIKSIYNMAMYMNNKPSEKEFDRYVEEILKQRSLIDVDYSLVKFDFLSEAKDISNETLIIHGDKDMIVALQESIKTKEIIKGSKLHIVKNSAHSILTDNLLELEKLIRDFIFN